MLFFVLVALLMAFPVVLVQAKRFAFGVLFISAGIFTLAGPGSAAAGEIINDPDNTVSLRFVTLDEAPHVTLQAGLQTHSPDVPFELTTAGYRAKYHSIRMHRNDLAELRQHIKYELRRGNITAETATTLNLRVDEIDSDALGDLAGRPVAPQQVAQQQTLAELTHKRARLSESLADTIKLVKVLDSISAPEFAGTFIAAKIQVVRLFAEKAGIDASIDEIRQDLNRLKAG